ncbi:M14 family metallopeptidase [Clostridium sp. E02]|uniref:M14 family metallopeptidase n=1 Tax=Clostridium sp. E02 TaxID=2487134 RepID=UPI000F528C0E|nr:M14 family metallopeptidase [Clostridium sp. E02]
MLQLENVKLEQGRTSGMLGVKNHNLKLPYTAICGEEEGEVTLITAGIHGAEYIGIQTVLELSRELEPCDVTGTIVFLLMANPQASYSYTRLFVPEDGKNLNRVFPGEKEGSLSQKIAYTIEHELQNQADYYLDLHGGDTHERVMPFVYYSGVAKEEVRKKSEEMAIATGMQVRAESSATTGSYSYAAIQGTPSILMERGGGGIFSKEEIINYKIEVKRVLSYLGFIKTMDHAEEGDSQKEVKKAVYVDSETEGFWYPQKEPGETFLEGELLGVIEDVWGNRIQECYGEFDGIVLYETVVMGVSQGDSLIAYGDLSSCHTSINTL